MRVLFTTTGYSGHVLPLVPLARACLRAGHHVLFAAPRSRGAVVERAGLAFRPVDDPPAAEVAALQAGISGLPVELGDARAIGDGFARIGVGAALGDVLELIADWRPDVIVRESAEFAGFLAAELHRIPHVRVALGLAASEERIITDGAAALDAWRGELGLAPDPDAERLRRALCPTLVPEALEAPAAAHPRTHRFRAAAVPPQADPDALVYLTFGTIAGSLPAFSALYRDAIAALADLPGRVLVTTGDADPDQLGPVPANVTLERWVPQREILARAAAVVCHGGYGTVLGALAYGRPLVVLPLFAGDQWRNARRVAELGAGIALPREPDPARRVLDRPGADLIAALPGAVERVIEDPAYRRAADGVADAIRALPPAAGAAAALPSGSSRNVALEIPLARRRQARTQTRRNPPGISSGREAKPVARPPAETVRRQAVIGERRFRVERCGKAH